MRMAAEDGNERGVGSSSTKWVPGDKVSGAGHRGGGGGSELLVCFPARTSMSLMPKPILSPGRGGDPARRLRNSASRGQSSPMFSIHATGGSSDGRKKNSASYEMEEPSSPKVTCVGQVRVKPKQCKSWQSVMEEIEKLHGQKQQRKVPCKPRGPGASGTPVSSPRRSHQGWSQAFGLKRELLQLMAALKNLRIDFGCFGAAASQDSEDEPTTSGSTVFAKWFMILQDNDDERKWGAKSVAPPGSVDAGGHESEGPARGAAEDRGGHDRGPEGSSEDLYEEPAIPPSNALLLMRCRSAPSRGSSDMDSCKNRDDDDGDGDANRNRIRAGKPLMKKSTSTSNAVVLMRYESDFLEVSKETWISRPDFINESFVSQRMINVVPKI